MGVYSVTGRDGTVHSFNIGGDKPTQAEAQEMLERINAKEAGEIGSVGAGARRFGANIQTGIGALADDLGFEDTAKSLFDRANETRRSVGYRYKPEVPDITEAEGLGDVGTFALEALGQSTPELAAGIGGTIAGGKAGAVIGTAIGGPALTIPGTIVGGIAGSILATAPSFFGDLVSEKAKEQGVDEADVDTATAAAAALGQAGLNSLFDRFAVGTVAKAFKGIPKDVVKRGFAQALGLAGKRAAAAAASGAGVEGITETAQQVISIAHRDPDKFVEMWESGEIPDSVQNELVNAFAGGVLLGGGIGGVAGGARGAAEAINDNRTMRLRDEDAEFNARSRADREQEIIRDLSPNGDLPQGIAGLLPAPDPNANPLLLEARQGIGVEGEGDIIPPRAENPAPTAQQKGERDARVAATDAQFTGPAQVQPENGQFRVRSKGKMVGRLYRSADEAQQAADRHNGEYIARAKSDEEIQRRRDEVIRGNQELIAAARETSVPFPPLDLSELTSDQAGEIRMSRFRSGEDDIEAPVSMDEIRETLGEEVTESIAAQLKPLTLGRGAVQPTAAAEAEPATEPAPPTQGRTPASVAPVVEEDYDYVAGKARDRGSIGYDEVKADLEELRGKEAKPEDVNAMLTQAVMRGEAYQKGANDYRLSTSIGRQRRNTPSDLPEGRSEFNVQPTEIDGPYVLERGKKTETFDSREAAARRLREIKEKNPRTSARIRPKKQGYSVVESRVDQDGNTIGRAAVAAFDSRAEAEADLLSRTRSGDFSPLGGVIGRAPDATQTTDRTRPETVEREPGIPIRRSGRGPSNLRDVIARNKQPTVEVDQKIDSIATSLRDRLNKIGLGDVALKLVKSLRAPNGQQAEGVYDQGVIQLALDVASEGATDQEVADRLAAVMDHELIHALREAGVFSDAEWTSLVNMTKKARRQDNGKTFYQDAVDRYSDLEGYDPTAIEEEGVAEAFRAWNGKELRLAGRPGGLLRKIVRFFQAIANGFRDNGFRASEEVFQGINEGQYADRVDHSIRTDRAARFSIGGRNFLIEVQQVLPGSAAKGVGIGYGDMFAATSALFQKATGEVVTPDGIDHALVFHIEHDVGPNGSYDERTGAGMLDMNVYNKGRIGYVDWTEWQLPIAGKGKNLDAGEMIKIARALKSLLPNLEYIYGWRVSGAKQSGSLQDRPIQIVPVKRLQPSETVPLRRGAKVGTARYSVPASKPDQRYDPKKMKGKALPVSILGKHPSERYSIAPRRPNEKAQQLAAQYRKANGINKAPLAGKVYPPQELMVRLADLMDAQITAPDDPATQKAYTALAREVGEQFKVIGDLEVEPYRGEGEPYVNSGAALDDIEQNNHLYFFMTENGYGDGNADDAMNPLLQPSGKFASDGTPLLFNDVFRIVHDYFGHAQNALQFGPVGEFNAFLEHATMFTDEAVPALAAETLMQNAWVNFGPHLRTEDGTLPEKGDKGYIPPSDRPFSDQKVFAVPADILSTVQSMKPTQRFSLPPSKSDPSVDQEIARGSVGRTLQALEELIPQDVRSVGRWVDGVGTVDKNGTPIYDIIAKADPSDFAPVDDQIVQAAFDDAIAKTMAHGSATAKAMQDFMTANPEFRPPSAEFWNDAMSLPQQARYWYELSSKGIIDRVRLKGAAAYSRFFDLVAATSMRAEPDPNMKRALSVLSDEMRGLDVTTDLLSEGPVRDALSGDGLSGLKTGSFSSTFSYVGGLSDRAPLPTNDRQVATSFGLGQDDISRYPWLYEALSRFYVNMRDVQNDMLDNKNPNAQPYETWQLQALTWIAERSRKSDAKKGAYDDYDTVLDNITKALSRAGLPNNGYLTPELLSSPEFGSEVNRTGTRIRNSMVTTMEVNTVQNDAGRMASEVNQMAADRGDYQIQGQLAQNVNRAMRDLMVRKNEPRIGRDGRASAKPVPSIISRVAGAVVGGRVDFSMVSQGMGYFGGVVSPNIRVPMVYDAGRRNNEPVYKRMSDQEIASTLSVLGKSLLQEGMAASRFAPITGEFDGEGSTVSYSAFVPTYTPLETSLISGFAEEIEAQGVGMSVNIKEAVNGVRFDVIPTLDENFNPNEVDPNALTELVARTFGGEASVMPMYFRSIYVDQSEYNGNIRRAQDAITKEAITNVRQKTKAGRQQAADFLRTGNLDTLGKANDRARKGATTTRERLLSRRSALSSAIRDVGAVAKRLEQENLRVIGEAFAKGYRFNSDLDNDVALAITGPRRFSLKGDPAHYVAVPNPRTGRVVYGTLPFQGEETSFVLFKGFHAENIDGRSSGFGTEHANRHVDQLRHVTKAESIAELMDKLSRAVKGNERKRMSFSQNHNRLEIGWDGSQFRMPVKFVFERLKTDHGKSFLSLVTAFPKPTVVESMGRGKGKRYSLGQETVGYRVPRMSAGRTSRANHTIQYTIIADGLRSAMRHGARIFGKKGYQKRAEKWASAADSFVVNFQDRMMPVGRLLDDITKLGGTVVDAMDTYLQEELFHGRVGEELRNRESNIYRPAFDAIRKIGLTDRDISNLEGMSDAARKYIEYDETRNPSQVGLELYLYARHAKERNVYIQSFQDPEDSGMKDTGSGMTGAEADRIMAYFSSHPKRDGLLSAVNRIDGIIADTNQTRLRNGLIDQETLDKTPFNFYVPLRGFAEDPDATDPNVGFGKGFKVKGREDRRTLGRDSVADNILEHVLLQNEEAVIRSEKNKVGQSFVELVRGNKDLISPVAEIVTNPPLVRRRINGTIRTIIDGGYKESKDILVVKEGGKEIAVRVKDPRIAAALTGAGGTGSDTMGSIVGTVGVLTQTLARLSTSWNPEFMLSNFPRDVQTALINSQQYEGAPMKGIFRNSFASIPAILKTIRDGKSEGKWGQRYEEFRAAGGQTEFYGLRSIDDRIRKINDELAEDLSGNLSKSRKLMGKLGDLLEDYNLVFENATRVSVFDALVNAGYSHERAAQAARNVTVNFNKKGEKGTLVNALYMFYNAAIQGSMAMANAAVRSKKVRKILATVAMVGFVQDMVNSMMSDDEDDGVLTYDKIPDYVLEHNLILMDFTGMTDRGYLSITLPYGFNAIYNFGRTLGRAVRGGYTPGDAANSAIGTMIDAFNPIGGMESFLNFVAPTVLDPVVNLSINRDFAERPIAPEASAFGITEPASQRYWNNTAAPYVGLANWMSKLSGGDSYIPGKFEVSPNQLQFMAEYMTGGAGMFVRRMYQFGAETMPSALVGDLEEMDLSQVPVIRKLGGNVTTRNDMERFIEVRDDVLRVRRSIRDAAENGDREAVARFRDKYPTEVRVMEQINALNNLRSRLQSKVREVEKSRLPDDYKSTVIRRLKDRMDQVVGQANTIANQAGL